MDEEFKKRQKMILESGIVEAYQYALRRLCENGLPLHNYFESCANYILEYDLIRQGIFNNKTKREEILSNNLEEENNDNVNNSLNNNLSRELNKNDFENSFRFQINISPYEIFIPIIFRKNDEIKIEVIGDWEILYPNINNEFDDDINNNKNIIFKNNILIKNYENNFNIMNKNIIDENYEGILMIRTYPNDSIENDNNNNYLKLLPENYFRIKNKCLMFLKFNLNPYLNLKYKGNCSVIIYTNNNINSYENIFNNFDYNFYNEKNINKILPLNLIRQNSKKFSEIFLQHRIYESENIKKLFLFLNNNNNILNIIQYSNFLEKLSKNLAEELYKKNIFTISYSNINNIKKRINNINKNIKFNNNIKLKEIIFIFKNNYDIFNIFTEILIDELNPHKRNRKILLDKDLKFCGFYIKKHKKFENILVMNLSNQDFSFQEDYDNENNKENNTDNNNNQNNMENCRQLEIENLNNNKN